METNPNSSTPPKVTASDFTPYADAVEPLARMELGYTTTAGTSTALGSGERMVESIVAGTLLWERALVGLRRAAQEHVAVERAIGVR